MVESAQRTLSQKLMAIFFPERCCCCGDVIVCGTLVCGKCRSQLEEIPQPVCRLCGCHTAHCTCGKKARTAHACIAPFYYSGAAKAGIYRLKFLKKPEAGELYVLAMAACVRRHFGDVRFDAVTPVPVNKERLFNQSAVLAAALSKELQIPYADTLLKISRTTPQRELPFHRRTGNLLGAYDVIDADAVCGKTLLLVDDVHTTGATIEECAKMLRLFGAEQIYAVCATNARLTEADRRTPQKEG